MKHKYINVRFHPTDCVRRIFTRLQGDDKGSQINYRLWNVYHHTQDARALFDSTFETWELLKEDLS